MSPSFLPGLNPARFTNPVLLEHLASIVSAALAGVEARAATSRMLGALTDSIARERGVRVVAAGKAAVGMAGAAEAALGAILTSGVVTADEAALDGLDRRRWRAHAGTHPRPSAVSEAAGRAALALADEGARAGALLLVCLSGGASAMLAVPAPGLTIADKAAATDVLLAAGLEIGDLNLIRRHMSAIKGGQLAARAGRTLTLAVSDVCAPIEDDPSVIGSGPTVGAEPAFARALDVVQQRGLSDRLPTAIVRRFADGASGAPVACAPVPPGDARLRQSAYWIVASRQDAMRTAAAAATKLGYAVHVRRAPVLGEARIAAAAFIDDVERLARPACVIASGETTVHVRGAGRGGRNQEFAVAALGAIGARGPAALASIGTDGRDGPTDAAGAFVDDGMWSRLGRDARARCAAALDANDAYPLLDDLGALVRTGATGTNVGDLQVLLLPREKG